MHMYVLMLCVFSAFKGVVLKFIGCPVYISPGASGTRRSTQAKECLRAAGGRHPSPQAAVVPWLHLA